MATLAETISRVCDDLSRPEDELSAVVEREILSAISHYATTRFAFNERTISTTLSATSDYAFSALLANETGIDDILQVDQVKVTINGSRTLTLGQVNWNELNALDRSNLTSGNPDFYAVFAKSLLVYPTPSTELPTEVVAHVLLSPPALAEENDWLLEGEELIRSRATRFVCIRKLDDFEKGQQYMVLEAEALRELLHKASLLQATGQLSANW